MAAAVPCAPLRIRYGCHDNDGGDNATLLAEYCLNELVLCVAA